MANNVTNYREVKYDIDTKLDAFHWDEFMREVNYTTFGALGDYYAVYENLDEPDDHDRKKYAVYLHSTGELICLMADCGCALDCCYDDAEYMSKRNELYKQIALLAGWPEKIPHQHMTWRDVQGYINSLPEEALDLDVLVWVAPKYGGTEEWVVDSDHFIPITSVSPFYEHTPIGTENMPSINLDLGI